MKFTAERDALNEALKAVSSRTKTGPDIPIFANVLIDAAVGHVTLTSHDGDSCSIVKIAAIVDEPGAVTIPCARLGQLVAGLSKGAQVEVAADGSMARVRCGRASYKFATLPVDQFPEALAPRDAVSFKLTGDQVRHAFKTPAGSMGEEQTRHYLCGICLHPQKKGVVAVATNGHTMVRVVLPIDGQKFDSIIVPRNAVGEIVNVAGKGEATIEISKTLMAVEAGSRRFVTKLVDGTFPDYGRVIPEAQANAFIVDSRDLDGALARLVAACDPKASAVVKLSWDADGPITASLRSDYAEGSETIECEHSGADAGETGMQVAYLRNLIEAADGEVVHLHIAGPGDPIRIENPKAEDFVAVCMPCRV
ncbi:MAG: DNA polymerase III subunit beta [Pseudolabrys sp.]|nr:DNA polymerase III subunit beta [Pseudolabrys sp.]